MPGSRKHRESADMHDGSDSDGFDSNASDSSGSLHVKPNKRSRGKRAVSSPAVSSRKAGRARATKRKARDTEHMVAKNLKCKGLANHGSGLAAHVDPFITELSRLKLGAIVLQAQHDALVDSVGDADGNTALAVERAGLLLLIQKLELYDDKM